MNRWLHNSIHWKPVLKIFFFGSIIFHGTINFLQVENFGTRYACIMTKVSRKLRDTKRHGQSSSPMSVKAYLMKYPKNWIFRRMTPNGGEMLV